MRSQEWHSKKSLGTVSMVISTTRECNVSVIVTPRIQVTCLLGKKLEHVDLISGCVLQLGEKDVDTS